MSNSSKQVLCWLDLEMTGLDPDTCAIVQIAIVLTDVNLNDIAPPFELTIWQPESVLQNMTPFVRNMHEKSGLLNQIRSSQKSLREAEHEALSLVSKHASLRTARLCGNSICQDRRFIARHMPAFDAYLHYRQVDVSSLKELAQWWYARKFDKPDAGKHTALHDVRQSIAELKYYRQHIMQ